MATVLNIAPNELNMPELRERRPISLLSLCASGRPEGRYILYVTRGIEDLQA